MVIPDHLCHCWNRRALSDQPVRSHPFGRPDLKTDCTLRGYFMTQKYGTQKADDRTLFSCVPYHFIEYFPYNETTIFAFATSVNLDSSLETLNTNFTLNFSLIASNFWIAWFNSSSE